MQKFDPKLLKDTELLDIIRRAPEEIDCADAYRHFLEDAATLVTDHFGGDALSVSAPEDKEVIIQHRCDNCKRVWEDSEQTPLDEVEDLFFRLTPGCETPSGECPDCGAFTYIEKHIDSDWVVSIGHNENVPDDGWVYAKYDTDISWKNEEFACNHCQDSQHGCGHCTS